MSSTGTASFRVVTGSVDIPTSNEEKVFAANDGGQADSRRANTDRISNPIYEEQLDDPESNTNPNDSVNSNRWRNR